MKCDQCGNEATVHEVTVRHGAKVERHLCDQCAASAGIAPQPTLPLNEIIGKLVLSQGIGAPPAAPPAPGPRALRCPTCKLAFTDFKQSGLLGCADCYRAFENQLGPMIERAHEGATHHVGKRPRRGGARTPGPDATQAAADAQAQHAERLRALRRQLDEAVRLEQYERAAKLRDELRRLADDGPRPVPD
jgi:protein arginine kinase activator